MEYEFLHDSTSGGAKAKFSLEHEVFGPWLEVEVGNQPHKITQLLEIISQVSQVNSQETTVTGHEYSVIITSQDVTIKANVCLNGAEVMPDSLADDELNFDSQSEGQCGVEDFRELLLSWASFNKH